MDENQRQHAIRAILHARETIVKLKNDLTKSQNLNQTYLHQISKLQTINNSYQFNTEIYKYLLKNSEEQIEYYRFMLSSKISIQLPVVSSDSNIEL
jgi:hypothetical protein